MVRRRIVRKKSSYRRRHRRSRKPKRRHHRRASKSSNKFMTALRKLKKMKRNEQSQAISMANNTFIKQFVGHLRKMRRAKLSTKSKRALKKHKKSLRKLISARTGMSKRRKMLSQKGGGFLNDLLKSIPVVGTIVNAIEDI